LNGLQIQFISSFGNWMKINDEGELGIGVWGLELLFQQCLLKGTLRNWMKINDDEELGIRDCGLIRFAGLRV